jgi:ATP-dependent RNA helicase DeaD
MSDEWWGVTPAVSGVLGARGWTQGDDLVRQVLPALARHGNAVVATPPSPAAAMPALAGIAAAIAASKGRALILTAPAMVAPVAHALADLCRAANLRLVSATGPARATRHLTADTVDILVTSPAVALGLHTRSALGIDRITAVALAWPEDWDADEATTVLLGELTRDAQRILLTGELIRVTRLVERHFHRALVVGFPAITEAPEAPPRNVRTLPTPWASRAQALVTLLEALDPTSLAVWTADEGDHDDIAAATIELADTRIVTRAVPDSPLVVCYDLPSPGQLAALGAGRDVVLLVPPGTERYAHRLAPGSHPIRESGLVDRLRDRDAVLRLEIAEAIKDRDLTAASYALAPLFDRYDPQAIAAACFALWRRDQPASVAPVTIEPVATETARTPVGGIATARLWVGVGRRDDATIGDLVAVLIKEVGLTREAIGRIELRETFSLVEVPAADAERIARALNGITIRRRKLVARVDRGPSAKPGGARPPRR